MQIYVILWLLCYQLAADHNLKLKLLSSPDLFFLQCSNQNLKSALVFNILQRLFCLHFTTILYTRVLSKKKKAYLMVAFSIHC